MVAPIQLMNAYSLPAGNIFASGYWYHLYHLDNILFFGRVSTIEGATVLSSALGTLPHFDVLTKLKGFWQLSHFSASWLTLELQLPENEQLWSSKQSSTRKELESFLIHLSHTIAVIKPGQTFLREVFANLFD